MIGLLLVDEIRIVATVAVIVVLPEKRGGFVCFFHLHRNLATITLGDSSNVIVRCIDFNVAIERARRCRKFLYGRPMNRCIIGYWIFFFVGVIQRRIEEKVMRNEVLLIKW